MSNAIQKEIFITRFVNNENAYALQTNKGSYTAYRNSKLMPEILEKHLQGELTLGVYAVNPENNTARWLCFDSDEESEESFEKLISWFSSFGIPSYRESRRVGRSGHLWVFLDAPIPTADAFKILNFGKFLYKFKGEIFPHSEKLLTPDKLGLLVRLPLAVHRKLLPEVRWGLFEGCPSTNIQDQLEWFVQQPVASIDAINCLLRTIPQTKAPIVRKVRTPRSNKSLLDLFPTDWDWTEHNGELRGRCPACAEEQHDRHGDNLYVNIEKNVLHCFFSGGSHNFAQIKQAALSFKNTV